MADKEDDASEVDRRIGRRLRELRLAHKLTQGELARGRYTAAYISSVERGKAPPTLKLLRWCAARLDRSVADLLGEPERERPPGPHAGDEHAQAAYAELQATLLVAEGDVAGALARLTALRKRLGASAPPALLWYSAYAALRAGDLQQAATLAAEYLGRAHAPDDRRVLAYWHWLNGLINTARGETHDAVVAYRQVVALLDAAPVDPDFAVYVLRALADALLREGVAREAHRVLGEALHAYERFADPQLRGDDAMHRAQAAAESGQYVNAYMLLSWAWGSRREAAVQHAAVRIYLYHALLGFRTAPADDRERELRQALALAENVGDDEVRSLAASYLAITLIRQGRNVEAAPLVTGEHGAVGDPAAAPSPRRRAAAALAVGWLAQAGGMVAEARSSAHAAAAALAEVADPPPDLAFDFAMLAELSDAVDEHSLGLQALKKANELLG